MLLLLPMIKITAEYHDKNEWFVTVVSEEERNHFMSAIYRTQPDRVIIENIGTTYHQEELGINKTQRDLTA